MKSLLYFVIGVALTACADKPREYVCQGLGGNTLPLSITNGRANFGRNTFEFCSKQGNYEIYTLEKHGCDPKKSESAMLEFDSITGSVHLLYDGELPQLIARCRPKN